MNIKIIAVYEPAKHVPLLLVSFRESDSAGLCLIVSCFLGILFCDAGWWCSCR
jgi:hypothetical protein